MAYQQITTLRSFQSTALWDWLKILPNSIALSDTIGSDAFFRDFTPALACAYAGVRQDSGDPITFANKLLLHYDKCGIDSKTKTLVFSNSLDFPTIAELYYMYHRRFKVRFGIGTNLTNDCGPEPLNMVIKMDTYSGKPVVKLSDDAGKETGDKKMIKKVRDTFHVTVENK